MALIGFLLIAFIQEGKIFQTEKGLVTFKSEPPLELIKASSNELQVLLNIEKKTLSFQISIPGFKGVDSTSQWEHISQNYLESAKFPDISFNGKIIEETNLSKDGSYTIRAKGKFMMHGVEQERIIKFDLVKNNEVSLKSNFAIILSDYNISIPKVVSQKQANEINVDVVATLEISK